MRIIEPYMYMYPGDEAAIQSVKKMPGLEKALEFISKNSVEKYYDIMFSSSVLRLTKNNAPEIYKMFERICQRFGMQDIPKIYIHRNYSYQILAFGIDSPMIMISTSVLEDVPEEMLETYFVSGIAALGAGHGLLNFVINVINTFGGMIPGVAGVLGYPLQMWRKQAYYTYDRARMVYSNDYEKVVRLIGFGEAPSEIMENVTNEERLQQGAEFMELNGLMGVSKTLKTVSQNVPWNSLRLIELNNWVESGMYKSVMEGEG